MDTTLCIYTLHRNKRTSVSRVCNDNSYRMIRFDKWTRSNIYLFQKILCSLMGRDKITRNAEMNDLKNNYFLVLKISCVSMTYKNTYLQLFTKIVHNACDNISSVKFITLHLITCLSLSKCILLKN